MACIITLNKQCKTYIFTLENVILDFISDIIDLDYIDTVHDLLNSRAKILIDINFVIPFRPLRRTQGKDSFTFNRHSIVKTNMNVFDVATKAFENAPSVKRFQSCKKCNTKNVALPGDISLKIYNDRLCNSGFSFLQDLINEEIELDLTCRTCDDNSEISIIIGNHS